MGRYPQDSGPALGSGNIHTTFFFQNIFQYIEDLLKREGVKAADEWIKSVLSSEFESLRKRKALYFPKQYKKGKDPFAIKETHTDMKEEFMVCFRILLKLRF